MPPLPAENATPAQIALGKKLFFDRRLSFNNTLSCGMCHIESQAFASTQTAKAVGFEGQSLRRNAPSLLNVVYQKTLFHDGRESELALQAWLPMLAPDEMANPSMGHVLERIRTLPDYDGLFQAAFGSDGPTIQTVGDAIAAYERTLLSGNSRFDQWYYGGVEEALTDEEKRGFKIFAGKGNCTTCHTVNDRFALFTDHQFHNTGIGYEATIIEGAESWKVQLAPGVFVDVDAETIRPVSEPFRNDLGRFEVTLNSDDRWAYKTPSLRDVSATAPYMHDGSLNTLEAVIEHYDRGGVPHEDLDENIRPLGLTESEKADLIAFLKSLDGAAGAQKTTGY
ncbi:MAG: cytochrome-c peroxidase [Methyloligella sp. ZOD6]